jgi:hypothetical protein
MGHKGNSIRKPKASSSPASKANSKNNLADLLNGKEAPVSKGSSAPAVEVNKAQKKR